MENFVCCLFVLKILSFRECKILTRVPLISGFGGTSSVFGAPGGGLFGKPAATQPSAFGAPATTTNSFAFNTSTNTNPFGTNTTQVKPFGSKFIYPFYLKY